MAKKIATVDPSIYEKLKRKPADPNCVRCKSTDITYRMRVYGGADGVLVFCKECGAILGWSALPVKK